MLDTRQSVIAFLDAVIPEIADYANEYGEPGYSLDTDAATPLIVLGSYWCRCAHYRDDNVMHDIASHYPESFARLESQGVVLEWHDEWTVDHENNSKAYRTRGDSYSWQPSLIVTDSGDYLTPDDDIEDWIGAMANNPRKCIPDVVFSAADLTEAGFTRYNGRYESGWHPGQNDDPTAILAEIQESHENATVVFLLDDTGQFDIEFSAWIRPDDNDE